ncbi:hypothetical protein BHE74_00045686, partial [Ensete ventricosum]
LLLLLLAPDPKAQMGGQRWKDRGTAEHVGEVSQVTGEVGRRERETERKGKTRKQLEASKVGDRSVTQKQRVCRSKEWRIRRSDPRRVDCPSPSGEGEGGVGIGESGGEEKVASGKWEIEAAAQPSPWRRCSRLSDFFSPQQLVDRERRPAASTAPLLLLWLCSQRQKAATEQKKKEYSRAGSDHSRGPLSSPFVLAPALPIVIAVTLPLDSKG